MRTSRTSGIYPEHEGESAAQLSLNKELKTFSSMEKKIIPMYYFSYIKFNSILALSDF